MKTTGTNLRFSAQISGKGLIRDIRGKA